MNENWAALEHQIWRQLKACELTEHQQFILAVSGGLDSMVLLEIFLRIKPRSSLKVAYYHHGPSEDRAQEDYRNQVLHAMQHKISSLNQKRVIFCSEQSSDFLSSEEQLRVARWSFLRGLKTSENDVIVTAHHLDDRLETSLLKMIRGAGPDGFIAFKMWNHEIFRPFYDTPKSELLLYAQERQLTWAEDPSNRQDRYLRNWLREKWLKDLDGRVPGGSRNLAKSLLKIEAAANEKLSFELVLEPGEEKFVLSRQWYVSLSNEDQLRALALFLKKHQIHSFTSGQLEEIRKRLDKNQKDFTFQLLKKNWVINVSQIVLR